MEGGKEKGRRDKGRREREWRERERETESIRQREIKKVKKELGKVRKIA